MTKTVKKLLISLLALVMTVCCGIAILGTQPVMAKAETETHSHCACGTTHQAIGSHTDEEEITWTPWDGTTKYQTSGVTSYVYLSDDVVLDGAIYVENNYTLYFCLNGKKLTAQSTDFRAFSVRGGGTLILTDCGTNVSQGYIDAKTHLWTDGEANVSEGDIEYNITGGVIAGFDFSSEGGSIFVSKGKLYTYGVNFCGNKTSSNDYGGGAVYISTDSTAELNNTTISGNVSPSIGSGLVAANNAMVTMNKCTFNNNHINAPTNKYPDGGCVSVNKNSTSTATLTMKNCVLENNSSINRGYTAMTVNGIANIEDCEIINNKGYNGAISVPAQGQLNLKNTTIKNNISNVGSAGGIFCRNSTINLSGRIVIADNTSSESNVYVEGDDFKINIVGDGLEEGSLIGIFPHYLTYAQAANFVLVSQNDVDYSSCFISDRPESHHIEYNSDGNIIITNGKTEIYTVTFDVNGVECTAPTAQTINVGGKAKQPTLSNVDGYTVVGWYTDSACTNEFSFDTAITEDITLYAKWDICYDVWVAGIRLNAENLTIDSEDNNAITTGLATYDPTSNTLTLDNFSYSGTDFYLYETAYEVSEDEYYYFYNHASIYSTGDLNVVLNGENTLNCEITGTENYLDLIKTEGALTISGGTLNATVIQGNTIVANTLTMDNATLNSNSTYASIYIDEDAIISNSKVFAKGGSPVMKIKESKKLNITNSTVVIQSEDSYYGFYYPSTINIDENSVLEISVENTAIQNTITVIYSQNHSVYAGESKENAQLVAVPDNTTYENKYVKIVPTYDVWVAGVQFDASNLTIDSEDNNAITGSATYDAVNNILTLDNFSYTGAGYNYALIYSTGIDLKIVLKGTNKLVGLVDVYEGISIEDGSLTIAGSDEYSETASLELTVKALCIFADDSLSIENAKLTTTTTALPNGNGSPTEAIYTDGDLSIKSSEVTVIAGDSDGDGIIEFGYTQGIISIGKVEITDSSVTVSANAGGIGAYSSMTFDNSTVIINGGTCGINADATSIKNSIVIISGEIAIATYSMDDGYLIISNSNVEISAQEYVIYNWYYYEPVDDYGLDSTGHAVYAGENKESATLLTEIPEDVFENKYLRFAPASSVTVNYGTSELANKEITIEKGTTLSLENPVIDGYVFMGWYNEDTLETAFDFSTPITEDITIYAKWAVAYDIWVAGIRLNAENFIIDSEDDASISGSATYDAVNNILTLNNFKYESTGDYTGNNDYAPIRVKDGTTIEVVGSNDIACNATTDDYCYAIYGLGSLTIIGNGDTDVLYTHGYEGGGIYSSGTLTIQNLKLDAYARQSAIHSKKEITLDKVSGEIYSLYQDGIYVSDSSNRVNIFNCNLSIEASGKGITVNSSVVYFKNSFVEIRSNDDYALWDTYRNAIAYASYPDKHFVFAGLYEDEVEEVDPYDTNSFINHYVKIVPTRKITLNFSSVGLPSEEVFVIANATAIIETPVIDGYVFIGWYNEDTLETAFDFSAPITENITLYAKFANYTQDMANINSQISSVQSSIATLETNLAKKVDTTTLTDSVNALQKQINDLTELTDNNQQLDNAQQAEINALKQQVKELTEQTIEELTSRVIAIETKLSEQTDKLSQYIQSNDVSVEGISNSVLTLQGDMSTAQNNINSINQTIQGLDGIYATDVDVDALKDRVATLENAINNAENGILKAIERLERRVNDLESQVSTSIQSISDNSSSIASNLEKINGLTDELGKIKETVSKLEKSYINKSELADLKTELESADTQIKGLITELTTRVEKTESDIASLVSNKADVTYVNGKIEELKTLIDAIDAIKDNYLTADETLKADLIEKIGQAKESAVQSATDLVNNAKTELTNAINAKADTATLNEKVTILTNAITTAENFAKSYTDGKVTELTTVINNAKQQAITAATDLVNNAKTELNAAIALKADNATVIAKFAEVDSAIAILQGLTDDYVTADTELKEELTSLIATAKQQAIDSATDLVNNAKTELNEAIALKADNATVIAKFAEVDSAIAILQGLSDDYLSADSALKEELTTLVTNTKAEIIELIIAGDKANADALEEEIAKLRAEIEALKNATNEDIKEAESNAQVLPTVIAGVAVLGDIALLVWLIIKRKIVK